MLGLKLNHVNKSGPRWSQSVVGDVSTPELLCAAHWNVWRHLLSRWFAAYPLTFFCRRWWAPNKLFFAVWKVSTMSSQQVIRDVQMRGLIKPHKWKCPVLSQFHKSYMIHVCKFRYGQESRQWEKRKWTVPPVKGGIFERPMFELYKILDR